MNNYFKISDAKKYLKNIRETRNYFFSGYNKNLQESIIAKKTNSEVYEKKNRYVVSFDLPGLKKSDIELNILYERVVSIFAKRVIKKGIKSKHYVYFRNICLPLKIDQSALKTSYTDGVLSVIVMK